MKQASSARMTYITPKGLEKLKTELEYLQTIKRREVANYLQETMGDVDDSEYLIALEEQAFVEGRIQQFELLLCNVQVIRSDQHKEGIVDLGSTVGLREGDIYAETFSIVDAAVSDPETGMISNESPLGKTLLSSKAGDDIEVRAPAGLLKFKVLAVQ